MSESMLALVGLTAVTVVFKGAGPMLHRVPEPLARRLAGLAPALLAGLVMSEVIGRNGLPHVDAKMAGVAGAVGLASRRAPLAVCVVAGAAVAALLRLVT
ncbi:MAG: hypothetical protein QOK43_853 [Acidimicrobiaceae bacterium]|jgi:branched-subunit amino acid transport protein|nr:hypothetical protein [Acidimicrobiaceae bacterium]MDQ1446330.1 hypothetical protein [Acidimicrobiaceae bacterium]